MRIVFLTFLLVFNLLLNAQVGIGTTTPNGSLEIKSTDQGVIIPDIQLFDRITDLPVVNPNTGTLKVGTLVYNSNKTGIFPNVINKGYSYWTGSSWYPISNDFNGFYYIGNGVITLLQNLEGTEAGNIFAVDGNSDFTVTMPKARNSSGKILSFFIWGGSGSPTGTNYNFIGNSLTNGNIIVPSVTMLTSGGTLPSTLIQNTDIEYMQPGGVGTVNHMKIFNSNGYKYRYKMISFISDGTNWILNTPIKE